LNFALETFRRLVNVEARFPNRRLLLLLLSHRSQRAVFFSPTVTMMTITPYPFWSFAARDFSRRPR
jgi:hypothetical protein